MTACDRRTVCNHYEHTPVSGWERNDTLTFLTDTLPASGTYQEEVGIRISGAYPFMSISLIVEQTVLPLRQTFIDTLNCNLIDDHGNALGTGISSYQYLFPLRSIRLSSGHSLQVSIRHDMKREILPGVSDVGIRLSRH